jgi:hypothetical protein
VAIVTRPAGPANRGAGLHQMGHNCGHNHHVTGRSKRPRA